MEVTFLKEEQIWGDRALDVIEAYGRPVALTDLAVVLGGLMGNGAETSEGQRTGYVWSSSSYVNSKVRTVHYDGSKNYLCPDKREDAARPVLPSSETSKIGLSEARVLKLLSGQSVHVCNFGEYPQGIASNSEAQELENLCSSHSLNVTGKKYTFNSANLDEHSAPFKPREYLEYEHGDKRYIRVKGRYVNSDSVLSNGQRVENEKPYWIEVQPIEWLMDKTGVWVAKKALFAGVQFDQNESYDGDFSKTAMKSYLDKFFSREMLSTRETSRQMDNQPIQPIEEKQAPKCNSYGIVVDDTPMSVKEQIDFYVENNMSFMLHGPSGVGKTARVEAIDPDLTAVPLWNGVLPEDIVGKVRYPSGEVGLPDETRQGGVWIAPDWYMELCKKCEAEPDKNHVLFIDEVTNARPTTQSLIFHMVLKKSISPSKGKLPKNAVVALAGNSKEESGAAYNMPEPLFRRMCGHIHLEADVPEWLEWASEKSRKHDDDSERLNIHPLVSSFVATYGSQVFYSGYDEENPQRWAMDPRGWEQISDIIYDNKGVIRRELLESKMGKELSSSLLAYAKNPPLSLTDVIEGNYDRTDIPEGQDAQLALALSLRHVNEKQIGKVRPFIEGNLGAENCAIFDSLWIGKNDERAIQVGNLSFKKCAGR